MCVTWHGPLKLSDHALFAGTSCWLSPNFALLLVLSPSLRMRTSLGHAAPGTRCHQAWSLRSVGCVPVCCHLHSLLRPRPFVGCRQAVARSEATARFRAPERVSPLLATRFRRHDTGSIHICKRCVLPDHQTGCCCGARPPPDTAYQVSARSARLVWRPQGGVPGQINRVCTPSCDWPTHGAVCFWVYSKHRSFGADLLVSVASAPWLATHAPGDASAPNHGAEQTRKPPLGAWVSTPTTWPVPVAISASRNWKQRVPVKHQTVAHLSVDDLFPSSALYNSAGRQRDHRHCASKTSHSKQATATQMLAASPVQQPARW